MTWESGLLTGQGFYFIHHNIILCGASGFLSTFFSKTFSFLYHAVDPNLIGYRFCQERQPECPEPTFLRLVTLPGAPARTNIFAMI